jgi:hypothetical protein
MIGPVGTRGAAGGAPRPSGSTVHSRRPLSASHWQAPPIAFNRALPVRRACPVATSATHSSTRSASVFVNAMRRASGDHDMLPMAPSAGVSMRCSRPVSMCFSRRPLVRGTLAGPYVAGLMRVPASRSIGSASSAMVGMLVRSPNSSHVRSGETLTVGSGMASRMVGIGSGGMR